MIQLPTKTDIDALKALNKPDSISIYAPYIPPTSPNNPNRIQLKNLLKEAKQLLVERGLRSSDIAALLAPANKLLDGEEFRVNHTHSLALFINREFFVYYRIPADSVDYFVHVGKGYYVEPILQLIKSNPLYFVLQLSHNNVRMLKGDRYSIEPVEIKNFPANMNQALRIDEQPTDLEGHSLAPASTGEDSMIFHGHYNAAQVDKELLVQFFRKVDEKIRRELKNTSAPLIVAGVDYLLPLYRQVSTYPNLLYEEIQGSLEHASLDFIRDSACQLLSRSATA